MSLRCRPKFDVHDAYRSRARLLLAVVLLAILAAGGCSSNKVCLRAVPRSPLIEEFDLTSYSGPKPSDRTVQLLRVYNLTENLEQNAKPLLERLQAINEQEPSADKVYAMAELAFLGAKKAEPFDKPAALDLYGASVLHAYSYLFDERFAPTRNPYDPQYRRACDLYNGALESALRIVSTKNELLPGTTKTIHTATGEWDIKCELRGTRWQAKDIERFEFVSDYDLNGLKNFYLTHGLGVPMIAVRRQYADEPAMAKYYPPGLSFPVTAFMRPTAPVDAAASQTGGRKQGVLEIYDPLATEYVWAARQRVPLESDLSTPLAYFLSRPEMDSLATVGLLRPADLLKAPTNLLQALPGQRRATTGLYMAQPYEPGKIPVLMVHGLWSSPMTWMEMFNDLRSSADIRSHYQFWFYLYPTGQPFWLSAADLRRDLAQIRDTLDPQHTEPALDQMVLIGHSMGGLVSRLQTINSRDDFWRLVCNKPLTEITADPELRRRLRETFFFQPNPSIRQVVTIGTPFHGSTFSNQTSQWLLEKLIQLPETLLNVQRQKLFAENMGAFPEGSLLNVKTSIDSLSPSATIFPVMLAGQRPPWVQYHNIIGVLPKQWWWSKLVAEGDGVVARESAHVTDTISEVVVPADHTTVHTHPAAVLEVRRILLEHLADLTGRPVEGVAQRLTPVYR